MSRTWQRCSYSACFSWSLAVRVVAVVCGAWVRSEREAVKSELTRGFERRRCIFSRRVELSSDPGVIVERPRKRERVEKNRVCPDRGEVLVIRAKNVRFSNFIFFQQNLKLLTFSSMLTRWHVESPTPEQGAILEA